MPRTGANYYLPSPPMPFQPGTLAAAEDVNTVYSDIATALTNSLPTNGAAALTGNLNMNGYSITGANNVGTATLNASSTVTTSVLNATNGAYLTTLLGPLNGNGQQITGLYYVAANTVAGNTVQSNGNITAGGTVSASGTVSGGNLSTSGTVTGGQLNVGYGSVSGDFTVAGNASFNGGNTIIQTLTTNNDIYCGSYGVVYTAFSTAHVFAFADTGAGYIYCYENGNAAGSLVPPSTARVKVAIAPARFDCLDAVLRTPLFSFRRTGAARDTPVGFVAEEQLRICPEMVLMEGGKPFGIDLMTAVATLYGAMQQLAQRAASSADRER